MRAVVKFTEMISWIKDKLTDELEFYDRCAMVKPTRLPFSETRGEKRPLELVHTAFGGKCNVISLDSMFFPDFHRQFCNVRNS